jgi:hypothetical protein
MLILCVSHIEGHIEGSGLGKEHTAVQLAGKGSLNRSASRVLQNGLGTCELLALSCFVYKQGSTEGMQYKAG